MQFTHALKIVLASIYCLILPQLVSATETTKSANVTNYLSLQTGNKETFKAYVVGPLDAKQAILLIHGWWGLNREVESWANEFAVAGYRVMAIDLFNGHVTGNPVKAKKLMQSVDQSVADEKFKTAIEALSNPERKVAIIGRSYGASQVIHAASVAQDKISAAIIYYPYGELVTNKKVLNVIKAPILAHFARSDFFLRPEKAREFTSVSKNAGLKMTAKFYDARHGFDKPSSSNFDEPAHSLALQRTYRFLYQHLN